MATRAEADAALERFGAALLDKDNVGYVAVVERGGTWVIEIGVYDVQVEIDALAKSAASEPLAMALPQALSAADGSEPVSTVLVKTLMVKRHSGQRHRPASGGDDLGVISCGTRGSLGLAVKLSTIPGDVFILTNWHVLNDGCGKVGHNVVQPSVPKGGAVPANAIGALEFSALTDRVDLAVAKVQNAADVELGRTRCFGTVSAVGAANDNDEVCICGSESGANCGVVTSTNASVKVDGYPEGTRRFHRQIKLTPVSVEGDSGAVVLRASSVVGLLFAGDEATVSFANHIDDIVQALADMPSGNRRPPTLGFV